MIKIDGVVKRDEPMAGHTSFRLGGPADLYVAPRGEAAVREVTSACSRAGVPFFLLGGGTNILVADKGIRGVVVDLTGLTGMEAAGDRLTVMAGSAISGVAEFALSRALTGMEFAYALPGTVGGAIWMNARCYDHEISEVLEYAVYLDDAGALCRRAPDPAEWAYKLSPFQSLRGAILKAGFLLAPGDPVEIERQMAGHHDDRVKKGHFLYPCAGSMFKNNRAFGAPTGRIIDSLGLKGTTIGGAQVAPFHANIIVNKGGATAADVRALIELVEEEVSRKLGLSLEREVILVGEW
jgi:UDP-N-acetylmuramate dehydrogenase